MSRPEMGPQRTKMTHKDNMTHTPPNNVPSRGIKAETTTTAKQTNQPHRPHIMEIKWTNVKLFIDATIFVIVAFIAFLHTFESSRYGNAPLRFSVFQIAPYHDFAAINTFIKDHLKDKKMCVSLDSPAPCVNSQISDIMTAMRDDLMCVDNEDLPGLCTKCVEIFGPRFHGYGVGLGNTTIDVTAKEFVKLRKEFEACTMRESTWSTAQYLQESNVTVHLLLWASFSLLFSLCEMPDDSKFGGFKSWIVIAHMIVTTVLVSCLACIESEDYDKIVGDPELEKYDKTSTGLFDLGHVGIYEGVILLSAVGTLLILRRSSKSWMGPASKGKKLNTVEGFTRRVMLFDATLMAAIPSITIIICHYHGWKDYDMIVFMCTVTTTIAALALADDVLNVFWSRSTTTSLITQHTQLHIGIMILTVCSLLYLFTANLPAPPPGDTYFSSLQTAAFIAFIMGIAIAPAMFHEFSSKDALDILHLKESVELLFRATIMTIMLTILWKADDGVSVTG